MTTWEELCAAILPAPHTITVEAYQGSGAYGDVYAAPAEVTPCLVDAKRKLVRVQTQDAAGHEAVSESTVYCPLGTVAPAGSRVALPDGTTTRVLAASRREDAGIGLPEHLELALE